MEWIKVSERKPEDWEYVWITYEDPCPDGTVQRYIAEARYNADVDEFEVWDNCMQDTYYQPYVVAWMPLPKPYDGD